MPITFSDGQTFENESALALNIPTPEDDAPITSQEQTRPHIVIQKGPEKEERSAWDKLTGADGGERFQTWPEKTVRESVSKLGMSMDIIKGIMDGQIEASSEQGVAAITNVTSHLTGAGLATAPLRQGVGTFGGALGASRTKNMIGLRDEAMDMYARGSKDDEVFAKTGWFRDPKDNRMKFEISDEGAELMVSPLEGKMNFKKKRIDINDPADRFASEPDTLYEVFKHPLLYRLYPELKNVRVIYDPGISDKASAQFWSRNESGLPYDTILLGKKYYYGDKPEDKKESTKIFLHEIQHWIQDKEGFAFGSNPEMFRTVDPTLSPVIEKHWKEYVELLKKGVNNLTEKEKESLETLREINIKYKILAEQDKDIAHDLYMTTPGEIEARNVELRYEIGEMLKRKGNIFTGKGKHEVPYSPAQTEKMMMDLYEKKQKNKK